MPLAPRPAQRSIAGALRPALPKGAHVTVTSRSAARSRALPSYIGRRGVVQRVLAKAGGGYDVLVLLADVGNGTCREWFDAADVTFDGLVEDVK